MPHTAIAYLYDEQGGFGDNREVAKRLVKALEKSMCSMEVKDDAKDAAQVFHLSED
jgi:hypothetical protein